MKLKSEGFSLVELGVWIAIVGVLAVFLVPRMGQLYKKVASFQINRELGNLKQQIDLFRIDNQKYPNSLKDLAERPEGRLGQNWQGPYMEKNDEFPPVDKNGDEIIYNNPPALFKDKYENYEIYSVNGNDPDSDPNLFISQGA